MEIVNDYLGLKIVILFVLSVYIVGFIVSGIYRGYRKSRYHEAINISNVFMGPLKSITEGIGYIAATMFGYYIGIHFVL